MRNTADAFLSEGEKGREMQYRKELFLKDGTPCVLRGATETDAAEVLRCFSLTHAETDFLLTYPEENSFTEADEAKFLKAREESDNEIEICAFVDGKLTGTAGIEAIGGKEKIRHCHRTRILGKRHRKGPDARLHRMRKKSGLLAAGAGGRRGQCVCRAAV